MDILENTRQQLDEIYLPLEKQHGIDGMRLLPQTGGGTTPEQAQAALGVRFPPCFAEAVKRYDFGNFETNNISFGRQGDYLGELVALNTPDEWGGKWWQGETRPDGLIVFAVSDPYTYILDCRSGAVYAMLSDDEWGRWRTVSHDFAVFVHAMAAIAAARMRNIPPQSLIADIQAANRSSETGFWQEATG